DAADAYNLGFLPENPDVTGIYDLTILDQVLQERGLPPISGLGATTGNATAAANATDAFISSDTG
ncbi:MAG: hypothetical protein M3288_10205, partial [Thermoproteota archaeon]|nr:hypothetical protein [Thermoproteota archaeon]